MSITNYTINQSIGHGGMATVYLAEHKVLQKSVAIKFLNKEFVHNDNIRKRFIGEARNMFKMSHPNIVKVTDLIDEGDTVAFVMEYIQGETLKEYLERKGKLNDDEIKNLFTQMLEAVGYVHNLNLVHRDIKPSNFMIDKDGKVMLMDFGIAKNTDATSAEYTQTGTGMQLGTPMYMSPEQITETKSVTAQSDIYSLGVVLWQMATGQKPYDLKSVSKFQLQTKIVNEKLSLTNSSFDSIITIATEKQLNNRFKNCNEIKNKLDNLQNHNFESSKGYSTQNSEKTIIENNNDNTVVEPQNNNYTSKSNNDGSYTLPPSKKKNNPKLGYIISGIILIVIICIIVASKFLSHMTESGGPQPPFGDTTKVDSTYVDDTVGEAIPEIGNSIIYTVYEGYIEEEKNENYAVPIVLYNDGKYIDPPYCEIGSYNQKALDECERSKELLLPSVQPGSILFEIENGKQTNSINVMDTKDFGYSDWTRFSGHISYKPNSSLLTDNHKIGTNRLATVNNMPVIEKDNRLLGKADIDGDGMPELIYECQEYEGKSYKIYSYLNGEWKVVYGNGNGYQGV